MVTMHLFSCMTIRRGTVLLLIVFLALLGKFASPRSGELLSPSSTEAQIERLFAPGRDLLDIKLAVDAMVDPSITAPKGRAAFEALAAALKALSAEAKGSNAKLNVLRRFLTESGPWNGGRPFSYDMADPLGTNPANKLLARYIDTRLGNCVTMPMLAMLLGRRIGLTMTLAVAPSHVFVKYTDDAGAVWNLEATSGLGFTRDVWYRRNLPMTDAAVAKGTYLRALSDEENAALMATLLVEHHLAAKRPDEAIAAANVILRHAPRDAYVLAKRGSAYALKLRRDVIALYPDLGALPLDIRLYADGLYRNNQADFAAAEALGWTEREGITPSEQ
ncbi:transglutaminase family protein [soil metagenome]